MTKKDLGIGEKTTKGKAEKPKSVEINCEKVSEDVRNEIEYNTNQCGFKLESHDEELLLEMFKAVREVISEYNQNQDEEK